MKRTPVNKYLVTPIDEDAGRDYPASAWRFDTPEKAMCCAVGTWIEEQILEGMPLPEATKTRQYDDHLVLLLQFEEGEDMTIIFTAVENN